MLEEIVNNKLLKAKDQVAQLSSLLLEGKISAKQLLEQAKKSKDPVKANCIEAIEYASRKNPEVVTKEVFDFMTDALKEKAPRIKWESAKVIGNSALLHVAQLDKAISGLLDNSEHTGTVVRWSAAFALGEILKLKTKHNKALIPAVQAISKREEKNSIRKIYEAALKKT